MTREAVRAMRSCGIGKVDAPLARGHHTFVITYLAEGVLRSLADHDELYWNVLGYYLDLPVEEATVRVHLPASVPAEEIRPEAYAGGRGVSNPRKPETELTREEESPDTAGYRATNLDPAQSLSVVVSWPKGFVTPPKMGVFARDRWLLAAPVVFFLYYLIVWMKLGPEPALGSVPVRYAPPEGLSPAAARYVRTTGTDARTLAAVVAQLAARRCIEIELQNGNYKLTQLKADGSVVSALAPEEARVLEMLFEDGKEITLHPNKGDDLNKYSLAIQGALPKKARWPVLHTACGIHRAWDADVARGRDVDGADSKRERHDGSPVSDVGVLFLRNDRGGDHPIQCTPRLPNRAAWHGRRASIANGLGVLAAFGAGFVVLLNRMSKDISPAYTVMLVSLVAINVGWIPALKRMTPRGRQAAAEIEGFRTFLEKVEQDQMQRLNTKDEAPNAAVEFLPYAIALEVKESWGDHLAEAFFATSSSR